MASKENFFIKRCFDLARLGAGSVSPNPMVGAVLVHEGRIIGEGYHQRYGGAHAEVNAVASVALADRKLISKATLFVSLEPCCIYGKTPPCTNLIIQEKIPRVVISCLDLTPEVSGQGVKTLRAHNVEVITGVLEEEGKALAATRNISVRQNRPYVVLKMAVTPNGFFAPADGSQFWITQPLSKRLVHRWRAEVDAILVGTNTARADNPRLDNRYYWGKSPLRIVLDRDLKLPLDLHLFSDAYPTLIITEQAVPEIREGKSFQYLRMDFDDCFWQNLLHQLWVEYKIGILLVEGGAKVLQQVIDADLWDEARVLVGQNTLLNGVPAPLITGAKQARIPLGKDELILYQKR